MIFSPDLNPLLGQWPDKRGYFCAAGVMTGFNQGGGIGKVISEWIIDGEPSLDIQAWDVARFGPWASKRYTKARSAYFYEHRSHRIYPYQQFETGRPVRQFPSYGRLRERGGVFGENFGFENPLWYARPGEIAREIYSYKRQNWFETVGEEARAVRSNVGLFDSSTYSKFFVSGPGAKTWLDHMLANRLPAFGRSALCPMLSPKGKLIGDFTVTCYAPNEFLILGSGPTQQIHMRWFLQNLPTDGSVTIENRSAQWCGLHLAGPRSRELLETLVTEPCGSNAFSFMSGRRMEVAGCPEAIVVRVSFTGELGYEIWMPSAYMAPVLDRVLESGENFDLKLAGSRALMSLRLEKGFPSWGLELSSDYSPWSTSLARFVKIDKGDFIGRNAALAIKNANGAVRSAMFAIDALDADAVGGEAIYCEGVYAGYTSSGGYGYCVGQSLALGYLKSNMVTPAASYEIEIMGERRPAQLTSSCIYDPDGLRMRT